MSTIIDLPTAKAFLMISHSAQDAIVQILADSAESFLSDYLSVKFASAAAQEDLDGGLAYLLPTSRPVSALTVQAGQTYPTVQDLVTGECIVVSLVGKGRICRADASSGVPLLRPDYYNLTFESRWPYWARFIDGIRRYRANYTAGYALASVPAPIKQAALMLIYRAYHARGAEQSSGAKGAAIAFSSFMDSDIAKMLQTYSQRMPVRI